MGKCCSYSAMHKKRYKFYFQDFYAQKSIKKLFSMKKSKELEEINQLAPITNMTRFYHKLKTRCYQLMQDLQMTFKIDFNHI